MAKAPPWQGFWGPTRIVASGIGVAQNLVMVWSGRIVQYYSATGKVWANEHQNVQIPSIRLVWTLGSPANLHQQSGCDEETHTGLRSVQRFQQNARSLPSDVPAGRIWQYRHAEYLTQQVPHRNQSYSHLWPIVKCGCNGVECIVIASTSEKMDKQPAKQCGLWSFLAFGRRFSNYRPPSWVKGENESRHATGLRSKAWMTLPKSRTLQHLYIH
jgi:hypothetical protein